MKKISLGLLCALFFTLLVGCSSSTTAALTATDYMDLGYQYLSELNYEEAILAFEKAIEIDPQLEDSYEALAQIYMTLGETEQALAILRQGIDTTGSELLTQYLSDLDTLNSATEPSATSGQGVSEEALTQYQEIVSSLSTGEAATAQILQDYLTDTGYYAMVEDSSSVAIQTDYGYLYLGESDGNTLALYEVDGWYYLYCGDMEDGMRQGDGVWLSSYSSGGNSGYFYTICQWVDDQATGEAYFHCSDMYDGELFQNVITGTVVDGLWNGTITETVLTGEASGTSEIYTMSQGYIMAAEVIAGDDGITYYRLEGRDGLFSNDPADFGTYGVLDFRTYSLP